MNKDAAFSKIQLDLEIETGRFTMFGCNGKGRGSAE